MDLQNKERDNFVPTLREPSPPAMEVEVMRELSTAPQTILMPRAGYMRTEQGVFSLATAPLADVAGLVAALAGILGWQVPAASLMTLLLALAGFSLVWLVAYISHILISPDGALFMYTIFAWGYLRREQAERLKRYGINMKGRG